MLNFHLFKRYQGAGIVIRTCFWQDHLIKIPSIFIILRGVFSPKQFIAKFHFDPFRIPCIFQTSFFGNLKFSCLVKIELEILLHFYW